MRSHYCSGRVRHNSRAPDAGGPECNYSHWIVPGGFDVMSSTTRFTPATSFVIRFEMRASTSEGSLVRSAVMASSDETGRSTIGCQWLVEQLHDDNPETETSELDGCRDAIDGATAVLLD